MLILSFIVPGVSNLEIDSGVNLCCLDNGGRGHSFL